jgi:hypothetical protein
MIRAICSWLIVLVLLPFTASLSTCDISVLLGTRTSTPIVSWVAASADLMAFSVNDDAGGLVALPGPVVLSRDSVLALVGRPVRSRLDFLRHP